MTNELTPFEFEGKPVRIVMKDGEPWWVAGDVCRALEIDASVSVNGQWRTTEDGGRVRSGGLDDDEKDTHTVSTPGGPQEVLVVSEAGLYSLVLKGRTDRAKTFKRWVVHEVLPPIRKNGMYATDSLLDDPDHLLKVTQRLVDERRGRLAAEAKLIEQAPKVTFAETCLGSGDSVLVRELAKIASKQGIITGEKRLYQQLRAWGMVRAGKTEPLQRAMDAGYFEVVQRPVETKDGTRLMATTKVTPKGQVHILERLRRAMTVKVVQ